MADEATVPTPHYPAQLDMDSQIIQDLLPGTGSLGSVPMHHDYKRAVIKPAPKEFSVEVLPPKKFGSGYCYGLRILPHVRESSDARSVHSNKTNASNSEYDIWRRWEDCLWFQDLLETEYKLMARTKRTRLAQGKGVKKNGIYVHSDQAASFESLPPGPDVHDIAKDVHEILPKLTKKGTLFRAGQATVEQRAREFSTLIEVLFREDLPTLIQELRENRLIKDFFGYWRRDKDHDRKYHESVTKEARASRTSITSSAFSMYFSSSNMAIALPTSYSDIPASPPLPQGVGEKKSWKGKSIAKAASFASLSSTSSGSSRSSGSSHPPRTPLSAPSGLSFTVSADGALITPDAPEDTPPSHAGPSSASLRPPSSNWSTGSSPITTSLPSTPAGDDTIVFVPDTPWLESFDDPRTGGLQPLPEEQELVTAVSTITLEEPKMPPRRPRKSLCAEPGSRNGLVFMTPPQGPLSLEPEPIPIGDRELLLPSSPLEAIPETPMSQTNSSRQSSIALTSFSDGRPMSWRTSIGSIPDDFPDVPGDLLGVPRSPAEAQSPIVDLDDFLRDSALQIPDSPVLKKPTALQYSTARRGSVATMNSTMSDSSVDAVLPHSLQSGEDARATPVAPYSPDGTWDESQDDLLDAYFYDPSLRPSPPPPSSPPLSSHMLPGRERASTYQVSTPDRFPKPFQNRPPGQFHLPWSPTGSSRGSMISLSPSQGSNPDALTVKAVRYDSIVLLRATYSMTLLQVRDKIREKFSSTDGPPLTDAFTLGFASAAPEAERGKSVYSRPRSQSTSALREPDRPRLRFISSEDDWQAALSTCTGKITVHVFDRF